MDFLALKAELLAGHPDTGAYNANNALAADELNLANRTRIRDSMSGQEMFDNTDTTEYGALTDAQKDRWLMFCGINSHNPAVGGRAQEFVVAMFGGGSNTVTALASARQESISRAEELGFGIVREGDVEYARSI